MNAPHDPASQCLADEAADLPARAASAARQRIAHRRQNRQRRAQATILAVLGVILWNLVPKQAGSPATVAVHPPGVVAPEPSPGPSPEPDAPITRPFGDPSPRPGVLSTSPPLPSGLDPEQTKFVQAVGDVPLLFVRDASGKVARIHIVQR